MDKDFSTADVKLDQSSGNTDISSEAPNVPTTIRNELVPHARDDENAVEPAQENPRLESNDKPQTRKGPRTAKGNAIASRNAVKHGIFSNAIVLTSESRESYDSLLRGLWEHFKPIGTLEEVLVEKVAVMIWRYRRLVSTETAEIKTGGNPLDFESSDSTILNRFPRYEASIERSFDRALTQLERIQRMRRGESVAPPIKVDVSAA